MRRLHCVFLFLIISLGASAQSKKFILSDIEGEYEQFVKLLRKARVITVHDNWRFGNGKLVIAGDLTDRGDKVFECIDLIRKLERQAKSEGGEVVVVLGNHEIMNMQGDFRYVHNKYIIDTTKKVPTQDYVKSFADTSDVGMWLRSKNIIEKVDDLLILHGGISDSILLMHQTLESINSTAKQFYKIPRKEVPKTFQYLTGASGPYWYRGYFIDTPGLQSLVDRTLRQYNVQKIVVGHTVVDHVSFKYAGKVIAVDTDHHDHNSQGLLIKRGKMRVVKLKK